MKWNRIDFVLSRLVRTVGYPTLVGRKLAVGFNGVTLQQAKWWAVSIQRIAPGMFRPISLAIQKEQNPRSAAPPLEDLEAVCLAAKLPQASGPLRTIR